MSRYINVEEFSQNLTLELYMQDDEFFTEEVVKAMDLVKRAEVKTETADVKPVVHAHWKDTGDRIFKFHVCSNCGEYAFFDECNGEFLSDYCPNCGAEMVNNDG